jgi:16S rRNA (uracil1498-N3)-methyltransferase
MEHDRYYIDGAPDGDILNLSREESHHLIRVRRVAPGAGVTLFDGEGHEYNAEVLECRKGIAEVKVLESRAVDRELPFRLTLAVAAVKPKAMNDIVRRATEIGVHSLQPIYCTTSVVHYSDFEKKREKWRRAVVEACKQCGRNVLPLMAAPASVAHVLEETRDSLTLFAHHSTHAKRVGDCLTAGGKPRDTVCFIGPEGGFTDEEARLAASRGAHIVSLGPARLTAETAVIALLSAAISHQI